MIINMELLFTLNELNVKSNSTLRIKLAIEMLWINPVTKLKKKQITSKSRKKKPIVLNHKNLFNNRWSWNKS